MPKETYHKSKEIYYTYVKRDLINFKKNDQLLLPEHEEVQASAVCQSRPIKHQKRPITRQKRPITYQNRPITCQLRPTKHQK